MLGFICHFLRGMTRTSPVYSVPMKDHVQGGLRALSGVAAGSAPAFSCTGLHPLT